MKSTSELRQFLREQMSRAAAGEIDAAHTKGVANLAQQIYNTFNIEVKMAKARATLGEDAIKPVQFDDA